MRLSVALAEAGAGGKHIRSAEFALHLLEAATVTSGYPHSRGPSRNRMARGTLGFQGSLHRVHLVPQFLVPETARGFSRFECDMPPGGGIGRISARKKGTQKCNKQ